MERVRVAVALGLLALGLAACETTNTADGLASAGPVPIAFEGFVGVPPQVGNRIAGELLRAAGDRRFTLVAPTDGAARYTMRGYLAPSSDSGATTVNYVWDLFDRSGQRTRRAAGDVRIASSDRDPWQVLNGDGARQLALTSAAAIERSLMQRPTPTEAPATPTASTAVASSQPPASTTAGAVTPTQGAGRRIAIEQVTGLEGAQEQQWRAAARRKLGEVGYTLVESGQPADARLSAEATVNPPEGGRRKIAFVMRVSDAARREVGQIRLMTMVDERSFPARSEATLQRSVDEALPGLVALVPPRR